MVNKCSSATTLQVFNGRAFEVVRKTDNVKAYLWFPAAMIGMGRIMEGVMANARGETLIETLGEVGATLVLNARRSE